MKRASLIAVMVAAMALVGSAPAMAGAPITGTEGPDELIGTPDADEIWALGGKDFVDALEGADLVHGGADNDLLCGGAGADTYYGGGGNDLLSEYFCQFAASQPEAGPSGVADEDDIMRGGKGADFIEGSFGNDTIYGGKRSDSGVPFYEQPAKLFGDDGNDIIYGGRGNDGMEGEQGSDALYGGPGDDWIDAADEETVGDSDTVSCGSGYDTVIANDDDIVDPDCEDVFFVPAPTVAASAAERLAADREQARAREAHRAAAGS